MSEIIMTRRGGKGGQLKMDDWFLERSAEKVARMVNA